MLAVLNMIIHHMNKVVNEYAISTGVFFIFTVIIIYISEKIGFKKFIFEIKEKFLKDFSYKWKILFFTYSYFILDKSLINRNIGNINNFEYAFKNGWLFLVKDTWNKVQAIENIIFFIPFSCFLLLGFYNLQEKKLEIFKDIILISFRFSLFIELLQLIFTLGTFQLSDIVYNTLGGVIGYTLVILVSYTNKFLKK